MRRTFTVLVATSVLMLGLVAPAAAHDEEFGDFSFRDTFSGRTADASWYDCEIDVPSEGYATCTSAGIFGATGTSKLKDGRGAQSRQQVGYACLYLETTTYGPDFEIEDEEFLFGCDESPLLTIADDLASASLNATIHVSAWECDEFDCWETVGDEVGVAASWSADGPLTKFKSRYHSSETSSDHRCSFSSHGKGRTSHAVAVATIDGSSLGSSQYATLGEGTLRHAASCRSG